MGRVLASGEGMLSVLDVAGDVDGPGDSAEVDGAGGSSRAGEASIIRCAFRTSSRCPAAVLGAQYALFAEEGDSGQLLATWLDMTNARVLDELDVDETVTAWTQLDGVLFALATPTTIHVVSLLGDDGRKAITVADPAVTCLSVRADGGYALLAAGHHDGSVSLTQLSPADTGVVAPQWTRHLHDGPVTGILLDAEEQVITGSTDRRVCVTPYVSHPIGHADPGRGGVRCAAAPPHAALQGRALRWRPHRARTGETAQVCGVLSLRRERIRLGTVVADLDAPVTVYMPDFPGRAP